MVRLWRRRQAAERQERRPAMIEELERLAKRALAIPLAAPILLFGGMGLGKATTQVLTLPEDAPVRAAAGGEHAPRIQIEALTRHMKMLREDGAETVDYVALYNDHVAPVERTLRRRGVPEETARKVAWPLVEHAHRKGIDPATVLAIVLVESGGKPTATSFVGARGLMQVMPLWLGSWRNCGRNLYDIEDNICHGTSILDWYLDRAGGDERKALLGYNGCVRGTNTPNCHTYPNKVWRLRQKIRSEWAAERARASVGRAAAP